MSAEEQTTRPDKGAKRPSRHAKIMRGVVTPIFGLLAVAAVVLGYMNATMWKPSTEITVSATMSGSRYVVTDPNVLTLLDQNATITVDSGSSQDEACVALGSSKDVAGWVASEKSYTRITGLASWSELSTQKGSSTSQGAPTNADDAVSFKDSDMWTAVKCGTGSVSLKSKKTGASTVAIVDLGENATNAKVQLHWVRSEVPDFAMPFYLSGGLLAVLPALFALIAGRPMPLLQGLPGDDELKQLTDEVIPKIIEAAAQSGVSGTAPYSGDPDSDAAKSAGATGAVAGAEQVPPEHAEAHRLAEEGDYAGAAAEYERVLESDPSDALAARERAKALLLARSGAADVRDVRAAAAAAPDDVEAQLAVADIDMIGGQIQDAFDRLLDFLAAGHKADIEQVRKRLLEYFAIPEPTDPRLTRARRRLATLMY